MKINFLASMAFTALVAAPLCSLAQDTAKSDETAEVLQRKLSAQQAINQQLKQRVEALERELSIHRNSDVPLIVGLDTRVPPPKDLASESQPTTAIEQALGSKGLILLPTGAYRFTPSMSLSHNGSGASRFDSLNMGASVEAGLPWGMAFSVRQPYAWQNASYGHNSGAGDLSLSLSKKLTNETASMPSLVARLGYTHDNGKDPFTLPSIGGGFRSIDLGITGLKRFDPVVVYGSVFYSRANEASASLQYKGEAPFFVGKIKPGDAYGVGLGVSLAATPDVSLDAGVTMATAGGTRMIDTLGNTTYGGRSASGYLNFGTNFLISRNFSLSISAAAGITKDASDLIFMVALPYRF